MTVLHPWVTAPRVDAQASEDRTGMGGWAPELDEEGRPDPWRSRVVQPRDRTTRVAVDLRAR